MRCPAGAGGESTVSQVFCSALAMGTYTRLSDALWEPLARIGRALLRAATAPESFAKPPEPLTVSAFAPTAVLDAAYEGTLWAAANLARQGRGLPRVYLTFIGGGVFGNDDRWICDAIGRAAALLEAGGAELEVVVW